MKNTTHGVTLIELVVAIAMASILTSVVFFTWRHITVLTDIQKKRTQLVAECNRVINQITSKIKRADAITAFTDHSVIVSVGRKNDTISYDIYESRILINNTQLAVIGTSMRIVDFSISNENDGEENGSYLLTCKLSLTHANRDTVTAQATVFKQRSAVQSEDMFSW